MITVCERSRSTNCSGSLWNMTHLSCVLPCTREITQETTMPFNKKPQGKNFVPRDGGARKGAPKAGSRSPGHRGFRPEEGAPKKARWNADDRAARTTGPDAPR